MTKLQLDALNWALTLSGCAASAVFSAACLWCTYALWRARNGSNS